MLFIIFVMPFIPVRETALVPRTLVPCWWEGSICFIWVLGGQNLSFWFWVFTLNSETNVTEKVMTAPEVGHFGRFS